MNKPGHEQNNATVIAKIGGCAVGLTKDPKKTGGLLVPEGLCSPVTMYFGTS